jgi:hypothetical protein
MHVHNHRLYSDTFIEPQGAHVVRITLTPSFKSGAVWFRHVHRNRPIESSVPLADLSPVNAHTHSRNYARETITRKVPMSLRAQLPMCALGVSAMLVLGLS